MRGRKAAAYARVLLKVADESPSFDQTSFEVVVEREDAQGWHGWRASWEHCEPGAITTWPRFAWVQVSPTPRGRLIAQLACLAYSESQAAVPDPYNYPRLEPTTEQRRESDRLRVIGAAGFIKAREAGFFGQSADAIWGG